MTIEIDPKALQERLTSPNPPVLLDVRQPQEVAAEGAIAGALFIPMTDLPSRLRELPDDRDIVAICKRGARSYNVANWLRAQGRSAVSLQGGIDLWRAMGLPVKR